MSDFFTTLVDNWPRLLDGLKITLILAFGGGGLAFVVAVVLGLMSISRFGASRLVSRVVVEFFRGTSLVVQLFVLYYVFPVWGLALVPVAAGIIALGLNYGAYGAEVVRGSLNAVPKGQWEVTTALSMSWFTKMRRVIWPQAWALMLPGFNNLQVMLVKGTAVAFLIGLYDLTYQVNQVRKDAGTWVAFSIALVIYYLVALGFSAFLRWLELRAQQRLGLKQTKAQTVAATAEAVA